MNRKTRVAAVAAALFSCVSFAQAQNIEWKQTINLPKGLNMPAGVSADIVGIQVGDTYAEAKAKALAHFNEAKLPESSKTFTEQRRIFRLPQQGGNTIEMAYVGGIRMEMRRDRSDAQGNDSITIVFSAPSSGHQVIGVHRFLTWYNQQHQARVSDIIKALETKFKSRAWTHLDRGRVSVARFQFNNGQAIIPANASVISCQPHVQFSLDQDKLKHFNPDGTCDVVMNITFNSGISNDHTEMIKFELSDNERGRQNLTADYAFFAGYVQSLRQRVGSQPKL